MISTAFEYSRATSLDDALAKLRATNGEGKLIAGGHSLVPLMKLRLSEPKTLIDIARIPGLSGITQEGRHDRNRRRHRPPRRGHVRVAAAGMSHAGRGRGIDRRSAGPQSRHARRQSGPRRSLRRLPGGDAGARRRHPRQGSEGLARGEGARFFSRSVHRRSGRGRNHRRRPVQSREVRRLRQAVSARVTLRHRRGGGRAGREQRDDSVGANRRDRRELARHPPDGRGGGARRKTAVHGQHRGRRAARRRQPGGRQLRHPCQRGVSARDDSRLHRTRVGARAGAGD